ncbi:UNVERIFIED_CONTAM: hypothetical protein FKN15_029368 [Acipenser sinensis]
MMSPTDAKRGGFASFLFAPPPSSSTSSAICSNGKAGASTAVRSQQTTGASASAMSLLTAGNPGNSKTGSITGLHEEENIRAEDDIFTHTVDEIRTPSGKVKYLNRNESIRMTSTQRT